MSQPYPRINRKLYAKCEQSASFQSPEIWRKMLRKLKKDNK